MDDERQDVIELLEDGYSIRTVARLTGIPRSTVGRWKKAAEEAEVLQLLQHKKELLGFPFKRLFQFITVDAAYASRGILSSALHNSRQQTHVRFVFIVSLHSSPRARLTAIFETLKYTLSTMRP